MSWRTTAVLFIVLLILGGYVYYQGQQEPEPIPLPTEGAPTPEQFSLFANATIDQVEKLEIYRSEDGVTAAFTRDEQKTWMQTVPTTTQVISNTMELQTTGLLNLRTTQTFAPDLNPASAYGLDVPDYTLSLFVGREDGTTALYKLLIGDKTPTGNGYYIQKEGDPRFHVISLGTIQNMVALIDNPPFPLPPPTPDLSLTTGITNAFNLTLTEGTTATSTITGTSILTETTQPTATP
jgi:hypothetical protein